MLWSAVGAATAPMCTPCFEIKAGSMLLLSRGVSSIALSLLLQVSTGPSASPQAEKPPLSWASVAIHVSNPDEARENYSRDQPDGITARGMSLRDIISEGYNFSVMQFREDEVIGLPGWAQTTRYDILARVDAEDVEAF